MAAWRTLALTLFATASLASAQKVISAKSGFIYFSIGRVWVDNSQLKSGQIERQLGNGETLYSERGRAEVLLNPGTVLRLGDMSRLRMDDVTLADPSLTLLSGSAVVTVLAAPKADRVQVHIGGRTVLLSHDGIYRFDCGKLDVSQARLRVYAGEAKVHRGAVLPGLAVRQGRSVVMDDLEIAKFDTKNTDTLERWAEARSRPPVPRGLIATPPRLSRAGVPQPDADSALRAAQRSLGIGPTGNPIPARPAPPEIAGGDQ